MLIDGVELPPSDVWLLAKRLHQAGHTEFAVDVGCAVDAENSEFLLTPEGRSVLLLVLERDRPPELVSLRHALWSLVSRHAS